nr:nuclear protein UL24 [Mastomys natalensis cytomegalovirus 3]WEG69902.1 nuclear protein UL24 [Mastomys natalensis cytomegalovirus 3]WEG70042.1 nuclear protein UL24 [Mastomys natalensis cytomegalovirus 3]WEG70182.1 nuclear protein UL24 [Mastomys natalensis cytomegalovirus 3]WEG70322.1 nuclear protein UL24 [Mastomys natalensis cytomegalovirus 3]
MSCVADADLLSYLPDVRKRIGRREHMRIYRKISTVFDDFLALNSVFRDVFSADIGQRGRYVFYEVNLGKRIPDCIIIFLNQDGSNNCYVIEFKTTMRCADGETLYSNKTHRLQYLQGLKQLRDSVHIFSQFSVSNGSVWTIYPVIAFFKQKEITAALIKVFKPRRCIVCTDLVIDYIRIRQDESVKNLSRFAVYRSVRSTSRECVSVLRGGARAPPRRKRVAVPTTCRRSDARRETAKTRRRRSRCARGRDTRRVQEVQRSHKRSRTASR